MSDQTQHPEIKAGQSIELLKELHILTRDGKMNQDSRRKLKQVYHLYHFIEPLLNDLHIQKSLVASGDSAAIHLVDHGAGKSYLGFIIYDLFFKNLKSTHHLYGIETRFELIKKSQDLAQKLNFSKMSFFNLSVAESIVSDKLPAQIDIITALHACDTATDDAIEFALKRKAKHIVLVPCCQAEVATYLRKNKSKTLHKPLVEIWRHALHTREFGSHLTNVLRCLQLEAHGYDVTVTELVGFEHSMKNELIVASLHNNPDKNHQVRKAKERVPEILTELNLQELKQRFFVGE